MLRFLKSCSGYFIYAGFFSLFINLLMLTLPLYMLQIFDRVVTSRSEETLLLLTGAAITAFFLHMLFDQLRKRLLLAAGVALDGLAGPPVLDNVLIHAVRPGENSVLSSTRDVAVLRSFLTGPGITSLFDAPWVPIFLFVIFLFHPLLGILALSGAIAIFGLAYVNERVVRRPLNRMSASSRKASSFIDAGLRNAEVLSALGMRRELMSHWQRMNSDVLDAQVKAAHYSNFLSGASRFLRLSLQILMLCVGASLVIQQHVSTGIMMAATLLLSRALAPVDSAIHTWKGFVDAREAFDRLQELMNDTPDETPHVELPAPKGALEVERAVFNIKGKDRAILKGVSFSLAPGESLGLIGPSAAGKSTLARLVIGIWRPTSGVVRLDGADVSTWPREQLGPYLGYLPQDVELFSGTVAQNIARLQEVEDSSAVVDAARRAHAHEMILRLPDGYDTEIGTGGAVLSAGQRQRVALARAVYGHPRLVVLDEPNANLDTEGEGALVETLRELAADGATVITISHRPSLLSHVDKLLVLRDGVVDMFGPRAEILPRVMNNPAARNPGISSVKAV